MRRMIGGASRLLRAIVLCITATVAEGCDNSPGPIEPATGTIRVVILTTGSSVNFDSDGYTLTIDDGAPRVVAVNTSVLGMTIPDVSPGTHAVRLGGVATNCTLSGTDVRSVEVVAGGVSLAVTFSVVCVAPSGSIQVSTVTSGPDPDADGYLLLVANISRGTVPANGTRTVPAIPVGRFQVQLAGVAPNCEVVGTNSRFVDITLGGTANASFTVECVAAAALRVSTATTGADIDLNYILEIRRQGANPSGVVIPANATVRLSGMAPGDYTLTLLDLTANCDLAGSNPQTVALSIGTESPVAFNITCSTATPIAFVSGIGTSAEIQVVNANGTGASRLTIQPGADIDPAWSPDGGRIAFVSERDGNREIYSMKGDGTNPVRLTATVAAAENGPTWSPDGSRIAFVSDRDGNSDIYVMNADGTNVVRLTTFGGIDKDPAWSPDGTRIAFASKRNDAFALFIMNADGSGLKGLNLVDTQEDLQPAWSPDGSRLAFSRRTSASTQEIFIVNADGSELHPLTRSYGNGTDPAWSPDGRKIAFASKVQGFYYYYDETAIVIVGLDGLPFTAPSGVIPASSPAWRPR